MLTAENNLFISNSAATCQQYIALSCKEKHLHALQNNPGYFDQKYKKPLSMYIYMQFPCYSRRVWFEKASQKH